TPGNRRARIAIEGRPDSFSDRRQSDVLGVKSAVAIGEGTHPWAVKLISAGNRGRTAASAARLAGSTVWTGRRSCWWDSSWPAWAAHWGRAEAPRGQRARKPQNPP